MTYKPPTKRDRMKQRTGNWCRAHRLEILLLVYLLSSVVWKFVYMADFHP